MFSSETSDTALMMRIAGGDHIAMATLYDRYAGILLAVAQHILGPSSEAEELLHDIFIEVWQSAATFQPHQKPTRSWLILRTRQAALEILRDAPELGAQGISATFLPSDWQPSRTPPHRDLKDGGLAQERALVQQAIATLPDNDRHLLETAYFRGVDEFELAGQLKLPPAELVSRFATVQQELRHALHDIRR